MSVCRFSQSIFLLPAVSILLISAGQPDPVQDEQHGTDKDAATASSAIVTAARKQIGKTVTYDPAYMRLAYPGGDVPLRGGVCTDVVIRALRDALQMDLQRLVHEDMKKAFAAYPDLWGLKKPDRNIDHRRVPNLRCWFRRKGLSLPVSRRKEDYLPGDLVTCTVDGCRPHIMIISDRKESGGTPFVIHNIGRGAREENRLFEFPLTGHYRISLKKEKKADGSGASQRPMTSRIRRDSSSRSAGSSFTR